MLNTITEPTISASAVAITPAYAKELLANNPVNRKISKGTVRRYADAMRAGDWTLNGEAIKISATGELLDGQHRLRAVIQSGATIESIVISGLRGSVMATLDVGKRRNATDILSMNNINSAWKVAGSIHVVFNVMNSATTLNEAPSVVKVQKFLQDHPDIIESVAFTLKHRGPFRWITQFGALHYLFSQKDRAEADAFFLRLFTGIGLSPGDGAYRLREKLIENASSSKKSSRIDVLSWIIKAWNAERTGTAIKKLHGASKDANGRPAIPEIE